MRLRGEDFKMAKEQEVVKFQSKNNVTIVGELVDLDFKQIMATDKKIPMHMGTIKVRSGEGEVHTLNMMAMQYYANDMEKPENERQENKQYSALTTVINEYITEKATQSDNNEHFGKDPDVVRVFGSLEPNVFKTKNGDEVKDVRLQGRFVSRVTDRKAEPNQATVELSGFVEQAPVEEKGGDDEDPRYNFTVRVIDYKGIGFPVEFVAGKVADDDGNEVDAGEWISENYEKGHTVTIGADLINKYDVKRIPSQNGGIGKTMVKTERDVKRERAIYSAESPLEFDDFDEDNNKDREMVVFPDQMGEAIKKYEEYVAHQIAAAEARNSKKESGGTAKRGAMGGGATKKTGAAKKSASSKLDDLPF